VSTAATSSTPTAAATPPTNTGNAADTAWTPQPVNYQYWAVKFQPYLEFALNTVVNIYLGKWASLRLTLNVEQFQAYLFADAAMWYQFDTSNPTVPASTSSFPSPTPKYYTNYKNYFLCSDAGATVKNILMSINF
jgi:hypothetical protein